MRERLNQVVVRNFLAKRFGKFGKVLRKAEPDLPGLVLTSGEQSAERVDLVFLFGQVSCHGNERLETHDADSVLLIL